MSPPPLATYSADTLQQHNNILLVANGNGAAAARVVLLTSKHVFISCNIQETTTKNRFVCYHHHRYSVINEATTNGTHCHKLVVKF